MTNSNLQSRLAGMLAAAAFAFACPQAIAADPSVDEMIEALATKPAAPGGEQVLTRGLKRPAAALPAKREGRLQLSVQFEFASATITPESRELLLRLAAAMKSPALEGQRYRIEGHTDAVGTDAANLALSRRRAMVVSQFLKDASGIDESRLSAWGMGSSMPANASDPKAAENRRVVIVSMEPLPAGAAAGAGSILQLNGSLNVRRNDASAPLQAGARIQEGDVLSTPAGANAIVRLDDGASVLVRAETQIRFTRLKLQGELGRLGQAFELIVGACRFVSGALGKSRPEAITFTTGSATVGIRGTDFDVVYTPQPVGTQDSGTYVRVNRGSVALGGLDGSVVNVAKDEQAYAGPPKPVSRGGTKVPAAMRIKEAPGIFKSSELDDLLEPR